MVSLYSTIKMMHGPIYMIVNLFLLLRMYILYLWNSPFFFSKSPQWAMASSFTRFLDHTQRRTTVGRTPVDEWSARRRDLYLATHTTLITEKHPRWSKRNWSDDITNELRVLMLIMETDLRNTCTLYEDFLLECIVTKWRPCRHFLYLFQ